MTTPHSTHFILWVQIMDQNFLHYEDTFGKVKVHKDKLWGPQTQRSLEHFDIHRSTSIMPIEVVHGLVLLKKAAARVNKGYGLDHRKADVIVEVCDEILTHKWDDQFPLVVWQTGSGTQSNMNVNEVISIRSERLHPGISIHPNNDVNMSQSSNDSFPTAMHIATLQSIESTLIPSLKQLIQTFDEKTKQFKDVIKIGRTHTQDATPISLGQEFSGYHQQLVSCCKRIDRTREGLLLIAQGGTAVGTGLNTFQGFDVKVASEIAALTNLPFVTATNKFEALACHDSLVDFHGCLNTLAVSLMKIANDIRFLGSGPRAGFCELRLPENQQGSSIMPGKVNPTQCEALTMVCAQVMGNNVAVTIAGSNGHFQLNAFKPVIIYNVLQSLHLLSDGMRSFQEHCVDGIKPNLRKIKENLDNSLMTITALTPYLGYTLAGNIAKAADKGDTTLHQAFLKNDNAKQALRNHFPTLQSTEAALSKKFLQILDPRLMLEPATYMP